MEPPIHTRYLRSGGATTRTFTADPPSAVTSLNSLRGGRGVVIHKLYYDLGLQCRPRPPAQRPQWTACVLAVAPTVQ